MADTPVAARPKTKKTRRAVAIALVCVLLLGAAGGGGYYALQNRSGEDVNVFPVSQLGSSDSWYDTVQTGGPVRTDRMQSVYISSTQTITKVFVEEGQQVKKGDPILAFDTTLDEVELTRKQIAIEKLKLELQDAKDTLAEIDTYKVGSPGYAEPPVTPTPVPPEPTTVPWFQGGQGTEEDPYVFLWSDGYMLDDSQVERLLVMAQPTPTPEPSQDPDGQTDAPQASETPGADGEAAAVKAVSDPQPRPVGAAQTVSVERLLSPTRVLRPLRDGADLQSTEAPGESSMPIAESTDTPTDTPEPSATEVPATEAPTDTPAPTATEAPTDTPAPSATDVPATDTPAPTATEAPTDTPATDAPATQAPTDVPVTDAPATDAPTPEPSAPPVSSVDGQVTSQQGAPGMRLPDGSVLAGLLTEQERQDAANGGSAFVQLQVSDADATAAQADRDLVEAKLAELGDNAAVGQYLDLRLTKTVNGATTALTDLGGVSLRLVIDVPEALRGQGRVYSVVRLHNGAADILKDQDSDPDTVTIDTDRFSIYALVYTAPDTPDTDVPAGGGGSTESTPEPTATGEPSASPEPTATPIPEGAGYYMVFEIRENDSMDGQILRVFELKFVLTGNGWAFLVVDPLYIPQLPEREETDDSYFYFDASNYYPASEIKRMRMQAQQAITTTTIQLRIAEQELKQVEYELSNGEVLCTTDGVVKSVLDPDDAREQDKPMVLISGGGGYYITAYMSEFDMQRLHVGDTVTVDNYMAGEQLEGTITDISQYPTTEQYINYYSDSGNNNASKYPFTIEVADTANLREDYWVSVSFSASGAPSEADQSGNSFYLSGAFLRSEGGRSYVYAAGADGLLEKRYVTTGKNMYGSLIEVKDGLDMDTDYIAFPYGRSVKDGAKTVQQEDVSILYNGY